MKLTMIALTVLSVISYTNAAHAIGVGSGAGTSGVSAPTASPGAMGPATSFGSPLSNPANTPIPGAPVNPAAQIPGALKSTDSATLPSSSMGRMPASLPNENTVNPSSLPNPNTGINSTDTPMDQRPQLNQ